MQLKKAKIVIPSEYKGLPVKEIAESSFAGKTNLLSITLPNTIVSIGEMSFQGCSSLKSLELPNSVTIIGTGAFKFCYGLTGVTIPESLVNIGAEVFGFCTNLKTVEILSSTVGHTMFAWCDNLQEIKFSGNLTSIGRSAFVDCFNLSKIIFDGTQAEWQSVQKEAYWNTQTGDYTITYLGESVDTEATDASYFTFTLLADGTYSIKAKDVNNMPANVVIPSAYNGKAVTRISDDAFELCVNLTSIEIPGRVSEIRSGKFYGRENLMIVKIPATVTYSGCFVFHKLYFTGRYYFGWYGSPMEKSFW